MKKILMLVASMTLTLAVKAERVEAIYVDYDNQEPVCYLFEKRPTVTYRNNQAVITVDGKEMLSLSLSDGKQVKMYHGYYDDEETAIELNDEKEMMRDGIYRIDGQLVIRKGEKYYRVDGTMLNTDKR